MHLGSHFRALPSQLHIFVLPSTQPSYQAAFVAIPGVFAFGNRQPTSTQKLLYIVCFSAGHQKKLTLICSRYYGMALAMQATGYSARRREYRSVHACLAVSSFASEILRTIFSSLLGVALQLFHLTVSFMRSDSRGE